MCAANAINAIDAPNAIYALLSCRRVLVVGRCKIDIDCRGRRQGRLRSLRRCCVSAMAGFHATRWRAMRSSKQFTGKAVSSPQIQAIHAIHTICTVNKNYDNSTNLTFEIFVICGGKADYTRTA